MSSTSTDEIEMSCGEYIANEHYGEAKVNSYKNKARFCELFATTRLKSHY